MHIYIWIYTYIFTHTHTYVIFNVHLKIDCINAFSYKTSVGIEDIIIAMDRPYNNATSAMQMRNTLIELKFLLYSESKIV